MSYRLQQKRIKRALTRLANNGIDVILTPIGVTVPPKPPRHKSPCRLRRDAKRLAQFGPPKGTAHLRHIVLYGIDAEMEMRAFATISERDRFIRDSGLKPELCVFTTFPSEYEAVEYMDNVRQQVAILNGDIACAEE